MGYQVSVTRGGGPPDRGRPGGDHRHLLLPTPLYTSPPHPGRPASASNPCSTHSVPPAPTGRACSAGSRARGELPPRQRHAADLLPAGRRAVRVSARRPHRALPRTPSLYRRTRRMSRRASLSTCLSRPCTNTVTSRPGHPLERIAAHAAAALVVSLRLTPTPTHRHFPYTTLWQEFPACGRNCWTRCGRACARAGSTAAAQRHAVPGRRAACRGRRRTAPALPAHRAGGGDGPPCPAGQVATTVHRGPYAGLASAHRAVLDWCAAQGRRPATIRPS